MMPTNGKELYEIYADEMLDVAHSEVEGWEEMQPEDRRVWDSLAENLLERASD
jgi:hypothetical protein